jgi:alpha-galactosidase
MRRLGVEADPAVMTVGERSSLAAHIALYKEWREVLYGGALSQLADGRDGMFGWLTMAGQRGLALIAQTRPGDPYDMPAPGMKIARHPPGRSGCLSHAHAKDDV